MPLIVEITPAISEEMVSTATQLKHALKKYAEEARAQDRLWLIRLVTFSGDALHIVVGGSESILWYEPNDDLGGGATSRGNLHDSDYRLIFYADRVHHTELPGEMVIPMQDAERAALEFLTTEKRPENVRWAF
ncbi:MAG TPA: Imm1 family immunity protein [Aquamicrobium sp.]|nr:Imm1 family immunity protein [Aquamicrobium sp.]